MPESLKRKRGTPDSSRTIEIYRLEGLPISGRDMIDMFGQLGKWTRMCVDIDSPLCVTYENPQNARDAVSLWDGGRFTARSGESHTMRVTIQQ